MPSVDVAMLHSQRAGPLEKLKYALARSFSTRLTSRDIVSDAQGKVTDVKTAFSSWDNCMHATFCKWPVIAVIIVGSLIIIAVVWCIIRCACCGVSCCCGCFRCLKCCGDCCGCCDPPKKAKNKYLDEPFIPPQHGYRNEAPMQAPFPSRPTVPAPPQYAEFDVSKKGGEDALPHMPSWEGAGSKKIAIRQEEVEMDHLQSPATDQNQPLLNATAAGRFSPMPSPQPQNPMVMDRATPSPSLYSPTHSQLHPTSPTSSQAPSHGYGAYARHQHRNTESTGFGLDEPYDDAPAGLAPPPNHAQQPTSFGQAPAHHPSPAQPMGHLPQQQFAEMPAAPVQRRTNDAYPQRGPSDPRIGPPPGPAMRRRDTGENGRGPPSPYGMDPRARKSPGPGMGSPGGRRTPGSAGPRDPMLAPNSRRSPYSPQQPFPPPNGAYPADQSRRPHGPPDRTYSPGPAAAGPPNPADRSYSPAHRGQGPVYPPNHAEGSGYSPGLPRGMSPGRSYTPTSPQQFAPPPSRPLLDMPSRSASPAVMQPVEMPTPDERPSPRLGDASDSPLANNSGFDFISGNTRPSLGGSDQSPAASPTTEAYPGQKSYRAM